jgi:hypothetical protein
VPIDGIQESIRSYHATNRIEIRTDSSKSAVDKGIEPIQQRDHIRMFRSAE